MRQIVILFFLGSVLFSCKKEKVPEPCVNLNMDGNRASLLGKWEWDTTWVNQTFASGNTVLLSYTPETEGFNYYCVITKDGRYLGYKDNVLVHDFRLTNTFLDNYDSQYEIYRFSSLLDCGDDQLNFTLFSFDSTNVVLGISEYPVYISDPNQQKYSSYNRFKRD